MLCQDSTRSGPSRRFAARSLAGALANVDFMNVGVGPLRTGVFNVADMAIMIGIAILLVARFRPTDHALTPGGAGHAG